MLLDKKVIISLSKYLIMFMCVIMLCHVISNNALNKEKCILIALGASTLFALFDYIAPTCVDKLTNNIVINKCTDKCK